MIPFFSQCYVAPWPPQGIDFCANWLNLKTTGIAHTPCFSHIPEPQAMGSQGTQFGNRWRNVGAREELPLYFLTYFPGMVRRQRRCRSSLHCHTLHNKWLVLLWVQWRCSGGESHPNPPQPFPCQSELTEQFHPTRHSTGGPSECLRPCTTHLMRPPLLCKLMPISYATLIFQSYHDCSVGRGLVPSCAKRASRPTNGSQGLELLSFSK